MVVNFITYVVFSTVSFRIYTNLYLSCSNSPMTSFFPGRRAGTPIQPNDTESAGLQREPWSSPHFSGSSNGAVPAPPSSDKLHYGYHGSAYATSIWLPACYWSPPSSTSTTSSIPTCHAGPSSPTRLHAASSTSTGMPSIVLWSPLPPRCCFVWMSLELTVAISFFQKVMPLC